MGLTGENARKVESFESEPQQVFRINRENILVVKVGNKFHAVNEKCPHMNLTMKGGKIDQKQAPFFVPGIIPHFVTKLEGKGVDQSKQTS